MITFIVESLQPEDSGPSKAQKRAAQKRWNAQKVWIPVILVTNVRN